MEGPFFKKILEGKSVRVGEDEEEEEELKMEKFFALIRSFRESFFSDTKAYKTTLCQLPINQTRVGRQ